MTMASNPLSRPRSVPAQAEPGPAGAAPLLRTSGLSKRFRLGGPFSRRFLHAVDDVDLEVGKSEIVALVGESGSGKSTVARLIGMLYRPTSGEILYRGTPLARIRSRRQVLAYHGRVPMVFQDPYSSMNPVYRSGHGIRRVLELHRPEVPADERQRVAASLFESVGLTPARDVLRKYPFELSGGQRQRVGFAQALASRPELILADEPVSMLDVSIRIGLLNLMARLRSETGVSLLYITHDIASARYVADRLLVMYAGHLVEAGPAGDVLTHAKHPYTQLLLSAVPDPRAPIALTTGAQVAEPPRMVDPGEGCRFRWRCPLAIEECWRVTPRRRELRPRHVAACHVATAD
jgi:peptide/nickel transport system ATP-binding protein